MKNWIPVISSAALLVCSACAPEPPTTPETAIRDEAANAAIAGDRGVLVKRCADNLCAAAVYTGDDWGIAGGCLEIETANDYDVVSGSKKEIDAIRTPAELSGHPRVIHGHDCN